MRLAVPAAFVLCLTSLPASLPGSAGEIPPGRYFLKLLGNATQMELYSIEPASTGVKDGFHGHKILGKTTVKDTDTLKGLVAAFKKGIEASEVGAKPATFGSRHGIRFILNKTTVDLLLCSPTKVYYDGNTGTSFGISQSVQGVFDKVLKAAGVQLAKPAEK